jgi:transposase-like protein
MKKKRNIHRSAEEWQSILQTFHSSGLTQEEFCKTHHLAPSTFAKWKAQISSEVSSFVEVFPPQQNLPSEANKTRFELTLSFARSFQLHMKMA